MMFGLDDKTIELIRQIFSEFKQIDTAILYGSRAKGTYKPGSDIDLTLKGKNLSLDIINSINIRLDDLLLPYTIDLSIYHQINNPDLIEHINRVGLLFYSKEL